jgi:hypothetical protein
MSLVQQARPTCRFWAQSAECALLTSMTQDPRRLIVDASHWYRGVLRSVAGCEVPVGVQRVQLWLRMKGSRAQVRPRPQVLPA